MNEHTENKSIVRPPDQYLPVSNALEEVIRELKVRARCYDKWLAEGKFGQLEGRNRWVALCSAVHHLKRLQALDEASGVTAGGTLPNVTTLHTQQDPRQAAAG